MKPHAIFLVAGIVAYLGCQFPINKWMKVRVIGCLGGAFLVGYVFGNFGLLYDPVQTINGIRAYPAQSNFIAHILNGQMTTWDHV